MTSIPVHVSDHALLRYLERVWGIEVEAARAHIVKVCDGPAKIGALSVRADGCKYIIANKTTITTVVPDSTMPSMTTQARIFRQPVRNGV